MKKRSALILSTLVVLITLAVSLGGRQAIAQTQFGPHDYQAYDTNPPNGGGNPSPNTSDFSTTFGQLSLLDAPGGPAELDVSVHDFRGLVFPVGADQTYFFLEDFQDGQIDAPGVTVTGNITGVRIDGGINGAINDSGMDGVDEDNDAGVDGNGTAARQGILRSSNPGGAITYDFNASLLGGNLPTHVGAVAGEGCGGCDMRIRVYAANDNTQLAQLDAPVGIVDPQFLGYHDPGGIGKIELLNNWEWDHVQYGFVGSDPPPTTSFEWTTSGQGDWQEPGNWSPIGGPPINSTQTAVLGGVTTGPTLVGVNSDVTVNRIEFNSAHPYAVAGLASVNLATDPDDLNDPDDPFGPPSLSVSGGPAAADHQFQAVVNLLDDTTVDIETGSTLSFNNALNLNGKILTKTGGGTLLINNALNSGGGTVTGLGGVIGGSGTVGGDVINMGGIVSPGNNPSILTASGSSVESSVPEPSTLVLLTLGTLAALGWRRSRRSRINPLDRYHAIPTRA